MSGFTITVSPRAVRRAVRLLDSEKVEVIPTAAAHRWTNPEWAKRPVEIVGYDDFTDTIRGWILDDDGMPVERVHIDPRDVATILLKGES